MKMITAIVNKKDINRVCTSLTEAGFFFTKMASIGGFLSSGNTTLIIGTENEKVEELLNIIRTHCSKRKEIISSPMQLTAPTVTYPTEVIVGGATVFVTDVEHFEKM